MHTKCCQGNKQHFLVWDDLFTLYQPEPEMPILWGRSPYFHKLAGVPPEFSRQFHQ